MQWVIAGVVGLTLALVQYRPVRGRVVGPALCRFAATTFLVALVLDASTGRATPLRPFAALDVSESWQRGHGGAGYAAAVRAVAAARPESLFLVGDSLRVGRAPAVPSDRHSRMRPAVDRAVAAGRPLVLVTDGEIDDPEALDALPAGSEVDLVSRPAGSDAAVVALDAPRSTVAGDTIPVAVTIVAGAAGAGAGRLTLSIDGAPVGSVPTPRLTPYAEHRAELRITVAGASGPRVLRAVVSAEGDVEPRNDTLGVVLDVAPAAGAVFVSTAPDEDTRFALEVLRGTVALPTRGYFRVSPGNWRQDGTLAPIAEADVQRAVSTAPLVVLQGDTAVFGPPRTTTRGALVLAVVPAPTGTTGGGSDDWYASAAPPSPLAAGLRAIPWDSLTPIDAADAGARVGPHDASTWEGLVARRGRRFEQRVIVAGSERGGRRVVVVAAAGLWRWRFRGGDGSAAFDAVWGEIFDWLATETVDERAAIPADASVREGDALRWRRGRRADSAVQITVARRGGGSASNSVVVQFGSDSGMTETPPLPAGVYDIREPGGRATVVVNEAREWIPRRPTIIGGRRGTAAIGATAPRLRTFGWVYLAVILLLCAEWIMRRRLGLR